MTATGSTPTNTITLGAVFLPSSPPEQLEAVAREADRAGLRELWLWEDCFKESGVATAAALLAWTSRVRIGIGLLPVPLRNVAVTAMEVATLQRLFPGRLTAGIGHGVQEWMAQVGARPESPMTLLREYTTALTTLLAGERVTVSGRYVQLDDVALDWPPLEPAPLLVGAVGPKSLALAAALSDGTILTGGTTPEQAAAARAVVDPAAAAAGRDRPSVVAFLDPERGADARAVAGAVRRLADAGADTVAVQPDPAEADLVEFVRFVAQDVAAEL
jgi:alkanesulfonate monooxygenase SsuD/methylene tetrahydromethanopterin reductase-like flavin-dependent oxidoreductase (luciferase family)